MHVATVLGKEEGHAVQYLPGESDNTVWPGNYSGIICSVYYKEKKMEDL